VGLSHNGLWLLVRTWFQDLFHPPRGVLFTFPSRYSFTIGRSWYLALESGLPSFPHGFTCRVVLRIPAEPITFSLYGILTLFDRPFQNVRVWLWVVLLVLQPHPVCKQGGLGCSRFARHYYGNLILISFRRATEMFQFTRFPPSLPMCSAGGLQISLWRGCPIRILRAHRLHAAPPERFAGLRVLHRPRAPRHPPRTLCSLFLFVVFLCFSFALRQN
jgi:hypothetical protein